MIYLDNAATTYPKPESVYKALDEANRKYAINAGRGSYKIAKEVSGRIQELKDSLRTLVCADNDTPVILAPSITVALNQIILGMDLAEGDYVYVSAYEHNAVARTLHKVAKEKGIKICELPMYENSLEINIDAMRYEFSKHRPKAVFCTGVSNVTGYILPVKEIFGEAKRYNSINVLDTAQSLGLIAIDSRNMDVDIIAFAGHKTLYGPLGIGGFINLGRVALKMVLTGGTGSDSLNLDMPSGMETGYEPASVNIVAVIGLLEAIKNLNVDETYKKEKNITGYLVDNLSQIKGVHILPSDNRETYIGVVSFVVDGMNSNDVAYILDADYDIAVRSGYHCAPFIHKYLDDEKSGGTVRIGVGQFTLESDIDTLCKALKELNE